jgi:hypothetical protein
MKKARRRKKVALPAEPPAWQFQVDQNQHCNHPAFDAPFWMTHANTMTAMLVQQCRRCGQTVRI